jgi:hypothetical protein
MHELFIIVNSKLLIDDRMNQNEKTAQLYRKKSPKDTDSSPFNYHLIPLNSEICHRLI